MSPALRDGDLVFVGKTPVKNLRLGDIIAFREKETHYIHRFLYTKPGPQGSPLIITKADRNFKQDAPLQACDFVGKVLEIKNGNRRIRLEKNFFRVISFTIGTFSVLEVAGAAFFNKLHLDAVIRGRLRETVQDAARFPKWLLQKIFRDLLK